MLSVLLDPAFRRACTEESMRREQRSIKAYLLKETPEDMPGWLKLWKPGDDVPLHDFLQSRIVFYPGAGLDGHAVKAFSGSAHCFVYADYGVSERKLEDDLRCGGFRGYSVLASFLLGAEEIFHELKNQTEYLTQQEKNRGMLNWDREGMFGKIPFMKLYILERQDNFGEGHGPARFAFLYMQMDAFAVYEALFANRNAYLWAILLQDHGFGGNYDRFGRGGLLEQLAERSRLFPQYLLVADNTAVWAGYDAISDVDAEAGGGNGHFRRLYVRRNMEDTSLSRMTEPDHLKDEMAVRRQKSEDADLARDWSAGDFSYRGTTPQLALDKVAAELKVTLPLKAVHKRIEKKRQVCCRQECCHDEFEPFETGKKKRTKVRKIAFAEQNVAAVESESGFNTRKIITEGDLKRTSLPEEKAKELEETINNIKSSSKGRKFTTIIKEYIASKCGGKPSILSAKTLGYVSRSAVTRIKDGEKYSKRHFIALAFGMQMNYDDAQEFLKSAQVAALSENSEEDIIYAACFKCGVWNLTQVGDVLSRHGIVGIKALNRSKIE